MVQRDFYSFENRTIRFPTLQQQLEAAADVLETEFRMPDQAWQIIIEGSTASDPPISSRFRVIEIEEQDGGLRQSGMHFRQQSDDVLLTNTTKYYNCMNMEQYIIIDHRISDLCWKSMYLIGSNLKINDENSET